MLNDYTTYVATKAELRKLLKSKDLELFTLFNRRLLPSSEWLLNQKLGRSLIENQDDAGQVIVNIGGILSVTKEQFKTFMNISRFHLRAWISFASCFSFGTIASTRFITMLIIEEQIIRRSRKRYS
jgi:hypothetical protein